MTPPHPRYRRLVRGSIKMALGVILIIALGLGWWTSQARKQAAAVALITKYRPSWAKYEGLTHPEFPDDGAAGGGAKPWWPPAFLERWLGPDLLRNVVEVNLDRSSEPGAPTEEELIAAAVQLRRLKVLSVDFDVNDAQVEQLSRLPALENLDLPNNNDGLTDRGMRSIGAIGTLKELRVNHTAVTPAGLAALGGLARLESLHTTNMVFEPNAEGYYVHPPLTTDWSSGLAPLGQLAHLKVLYLSVPTIDGAGLRHLGKIKSLKMLEIDGLSCHDEDLRPLAALTNLQVLGLSDTTIDGAGFRHLGGLSQLAHVIIRRAPKLTDPMIPAIASLPALETAMLDGSHLTADGLLAFRAAPHLRFLLVEPAVADEAARLQQALPRCQVQNGPGGTGGTVGYAIDLK